MGQEGANRPAHRSVPILLIDPLADANPRGSPSHGGTGSGLESLRIRRNLLLF